jgi:hypothetical protein
MRTRAENQVAPADAAFRMELAEKWIVMDLGAAAAARAMIVAARNEVPDACGIKKGALPKCNAPFFRTPSDAE